MIENILIYELGRKDCKVKLNAIDHVSYCRAFSLKCLKDQMSGIKESITDWFLGATRTPNGASGTGS